MVWFNILLIYYFINAQNLLKQNNNDKGEKILFNFDNFKKNNLTF